MFILITVRTLNLTKWYIYFPLCFEELKHSIISDRTSSYMDHLVKDAISIRLNNKNFQHGLWPHVEPCLASCDKHAIQARSRPDEASF
jgi:hypothetical protein